MAKFFLVILIILTNLSCGSAPPANNANTQLVVHYNGKEVHRRGGEYISEQKLVSLVRAEKEFIIIFAADWCNACKLTKKALKQANLKKPIYYLNIDSDWVQKLAAMMHIKSIPLMVHTDSTGETKASLIGPSDIVLYLLLNFS